ncbi:uncharacterized protein LOC132186504 [Corylus avellana]|uniref:uncharacterized protein LOC132186504 n=1 Tax=Corylus avellana TaxID=13451 RepID=UPI00286D5624|nr:uncharacterized protein LOC132186504 [Corylus avellana]
MQTNHTAGTSSFVNVIHKKAKITKSIPNPIEIYKQTHVRKKDGKFVSDYAESKYDEMKSIDSSNSDNISQEDIVLKVLGGHRSGHVRGQGCGAIPIRLNSSSTEHHDECLAQQLETEKKLAESLEKCEKLEEIQVAMKAEMQEAQAAMKAEMQEAKAAMKAEMEESKASQAALQAQVNMLLKHFGGLGGNSHGSQASESNV